MAPHASHTHAHHRPPPQHKNALHHAAAGGHAAVVQVLLRHRVDVHAVDARGSMPLHYAAYFGHKETVQVGAAKYCRGLLRAATGWHGYA